MHLNISQTAERERQKKDLKSSQRKRSFIKTVHRLTADIVTAAKIEAKNRRLCIFTMMK